MKKTWGEPIFKVNKITKVMSNVIEDNTEIELFIHPDIDYKGREDLYVKFRYRNNIFNFGMEQARIFTGQELIFDDFVNIFRILYRKKHLTHMKFDRVKLFPMINEIIFYYEDDNYTLCLNSDIFSECFPGIYEAIQSRGLMGDPLVIMTISKKCDEFYNIVISKSIVKYKPIPNDALIEIFGNDYSGFEKICQSMRTNLITDSDEVKLYGRYDMHKNKYALYNADTDCVIYADAAKLNEYKIPFQHKIGDIQNLL